MREKSFSLLPDRKIARCVYLFMYGLRFVVACLLGGDTCVRCGKQSGVYPLCPPCMRHFVDAALPVSAETASARCVICGKALLSEIKLCSACREEPALVHTDGVFPLHAYRLWKKNLLFAWKTEDKRTLSLVFARMVYNAYKELCARFGSQIPVVPVPPRPGKIKERGWDQIDELCHFLHTGWNVPVLKLLVRRTHVQQKKLGRLARRKVSSQSYFLAGEKRLRRLAPVPPEEVILLDDVLTTGSTLEACASQLKAFGVRKVYALTLFSVA
ncbi:MAG: ComF family protein [Treponema sp.]|nr:ComF family protein [Treponema sp.]